jgi:phosphomevalonate kinase
VKRLCASAPGKLVLLGEYAVLFGHPAVVMAVNRRADVRLEASGSAEWTVAAPGFEDHPAAFRFDGERGFCWNDPDGAAAARLGLVQRTAEGLVDSGLLNSQPLEPARMILDTQAFFHPTAGGKVKLGIGSSAALTVALAAALRTWNGEDARSDGFSIGELLDLHRSFQGGFGSGIDLAASRNGGVLEYRLVAGGRRPVAEKLILPKDLRMVFVWTGRSASTASFLSRLAEGLQAGNGAIARALDDLGRLSAVGIMHLRAGDTAAFLQTVNDFASAMECLGDAAGIPILSDEHMALTRLADAFAMAYKPSGAGGGDLGIAFTDDPDAAAAFRAESEGEGFAILDLKVDNRGVATEFIIHNS